ncbi:MAG: hypothetical protein AB1512_14875 [Thermodesulfobacteriota bacterium]
MKLISERFEAGLVSGLLRLPVVSYYAGTRGGPFVVAWGHRITGFLALLVFLFHIYLWKPAPDSGEFFLVRLLLWVWSIPVIFHSFNGARLIQYECWGRRDDENMLRWVFGLLGVYVLLLALFMIVGGQRVSPFLYWMMTTAGALATGYAAWARIWPTGHSLFWKLQRVSGAFLLVMIPAYILFIAVNPVESAGAGAVARGIQFVSLRIIYLLLLLAACFHGGYGVWCVVSDYLSSRVLRKLLAVAVTLLLLVSLWGGVGIVMRV